jgi:dolichyl-phosphate beta-glucosyltransferase
MPKPPYLSVVIPAFDEESRLPATLDAVRAFLAVQDYEWEVLVVNDGSEDRTAEVVRAAGATDRRIRLLEYSDNRGKGYAVRHGMTHALGTRRLFMDADHSTSIDQVRSFLPYLDRGYEVVIGSRGLQDAEIQVHQSRWKELLGGLGNLWIQAWLLPGIKDTQAGFKLFSAKATADIFPRMTMDRWAFDVETLAVARYKGHRIHEHPIRWANVPPSKVTPSAYIEVLKGVVKVRLNLRRGVYDRAIPEEPGTARRSGARS